VKQKTLFLDFVSSDEFAPKQSLEMGVNLAGYYDWMIKRDVKFYEVIITLRCAVLCKSWQLVSLQQLGPEQRAPGFRHQHKATHVTV
jgi:hypothetical protein